MSGPASRTNGFLFADLRDYTKYVESRGDAAAAVLLQAYRALVRTEVAKFGGAEIKTEGDSFYVVFPSASSAVQCGLAILEAAANRSRDGSVPIRVGIGVHAGETVETAEGYVGSAVNMAARVCSQARAGELLVTDTVRALTRTFLPVHFVDRRTRRLKGIAEPVVLYRVDSTAAGAAATAGARRLRLPERATGMTRAARAALLLLGLFVGGAASGYLLIAAQRPAAGPPTTPAPTPSPLDTVDSSADAALIETVPLPIRDSCAPIGNESERLGNVASVRCDLDAAEDADTVWYDRFATPQQPQTAFENLRLQEHPPFVASGCSPTVSRAQGNWSTGTHAGRVMCFQEDGATWIIWTYNADRVLARAVREGESAEDWAALYAWWDQIKLFQQ